MFTTEAGLAATEPGAPVTLPPASAAWRRRLAMSAVVVASVAFFAVEALRTSAHGLVGPTPGPTSGGWLALATVSVGAAYLASAAAWLLSSPRRLPYWRTVGVGFAASAANRVVPAGLAGTGLLLRFFNRCGLSAAESTATLVVNRIAGGIATLLLMSAATGSVHVPGLHARLLVSAAGLATVIAGVGWLAARRSERLRGHLGRGLDVLTDAAIALRALLRQPHRAAGLLVVSAGWTVAQTFALLSVLQAFGPQRSFGTVLLVVIGGMIAGTAVPTPNGLGATDAVLVAGLTSTGATGGVLTVVVVYRLMTFWLPVLPGLLAARTLRARAAL